MHDRFRVGLQELVYLVDYFVSRESCVRLRLVASGNNRKFFKVQFCRHGESPLLLGGT